MEKQQQQQEVLGLSRCCQTYREAPATARGAWTIRELSDIWRSTSNSKRCLDYQGVVRYIEKHQQQQEVLGLPGELPDIWRSTSNSKSCLDYQGVVRYIEKHQQQQEVLGLPGELPDIWRSTSNSKRCLDYQWSSMESCHRAVKVT